MVSIKEYINKINNDSNKWDKQNSYIRNNSMPEELKKVVSSQKYIDLKYNQKQQDYLENKFNIPSKTFSTFVYLEKDIVRDKKEENRQQELIDSGYEKIKWNSPRLKELEGKEIKAIVNFEKIGLMGSFDKPEEAIGKIKKFNENTFYFIKKGKRTRGTVIKDYIFVKHPNAINYKSIRNKGNIYTSGLKPVKVKSYTRKN